LMKQARQAIIEQRFAAFAETFLQNYEPEKEAL
jgi:hypothetical protein